jgi:hypothetical protein
MASSVETKVAGVSERTVQLCVPAEKLSFWLVGLSAPGMAILFKASIIGQ